MTKTKYDEIHMTLREKMEDGTYGFQESLPSEDTLVKESDCSRNVVRRTVRQPAPEGYMQSTHNKGVRIIYQPGQQQSEFILGGIESLKETVARNRKNYTARVVCFAELIVDETIQRGITFLVGAQTYYIQCVRCVEGGALTIDHNYFLKDVVWDPTPEIAERSIHEYMKKDLDGSTMTIGRKATVERVNQVDGTHLDLEDYNCMAMVSSVTHNKEGVMSGFTQSKHKPDQSVLYDLAYRTK